MPGATPAPRRAASPASLTTPRYTADFILPVNLQSIYVDTGFGPVTMHLPKLSTEIPANTPYVVHWFGPQPLTLQPHADDDISPPAGGPGTPLDMEAFGTEFFVLLADVPNNQWLLMSAANLEGIAGLFQGLDQRMRGFHFGPFGVQVGQVRECEIQGLTGLGKDTTSRLVLRLQIWDDQAYTTPSVAATGALGTGAKGTVLSGSGTNDLVIQLDATGAFSLAVDDGAAPGDLFFTLTAVLPNVNNAGFYLQALEATTDNWAP